MFGWKEGSSVFVLIDKNNVFVFYWYGWKEGSSLFVG